MTRPRVSMDISLGQLIQIASIAGLGLILWGARGEQGANTARTVEGFDARLTRELGDVRSSIDALRQTVTPIGTLLSRLSEAERRLTEQDTRDNSQDQRLSTLAEAVAVLRARQDAVGQPGRPVRP